MDNNYTKKSLKNHEPPVEAVECTSKICKVVYDDGTETFFWKAHRISMLGIFLCILFYVTFIEEATQDTEHNIKRGILAGILAFVFFGITYTPDGPFKRPHPAFWRLVLCLSIVYELSLVFLLFQTADFSRTVFKFIDNKLGVELPEKSYGGNCRIYDNENEDPFHNLYDKLDIFVPCHFIGWWAKTLILRDVWIAQVISISFELLEYTLEHQLPNFSECWWDHWILDALLCNSLGIYCGMITLNYLKIKRFHWRGLWNIPSYRGKLTRILKQFTPYSWKDFNWAPSKSLKRCLFVVFVIICFLLAELNTFYLKFILWIPPSHNLCLLRLILILLMGAVAMREVFDFLDDEFCKTLGAQSWLVISIITTELCLTLKFDWKLISLPFPNYVTICWCIVSFGLLTWIVWYFYLKRFLWYTEEKIANSKKEFILNQSVSAVKENRSRSFVRNY